MASLLGNIAGAVLGGIGSFFGGSSQNDANSALASEQMRFSRDSQLFQSEQNWLMYNQNVADNLQQWYREAVNARENAQLSFQRQQALQWQSEAFTAQQMQEAMNFNERMANTSWQRGIADMRAAGINPVLSVSQGGASSPAAPLGQGQSPGSAMATTPGVTNRGSAAVSPASYQRAVAGDPLGAAVATAQQAGKLVTELDQMQALADRTRGETELNIARAGQVRAQTALQIAQAETEGYRPAEIRARTATEHLRPGQVRADTSSALASARAALARADLTDAQRDEVLQELRRFENYGPRGTIPNAMASFETFMARMERDLRNTGGDAAESMKRIRQWLIDNLPAALPSQGSGISGELRSRRARQLLRHNDRAMELLR